MDAKFCCNKPVQIAEKDGIHAEWCSVCGRVGKGATSSEASNSFDASKPVRPSSAREFANFVHSRELELKSVAAPFVFGQPGLFERMMAKNAEYISSLSSPTYDKAWETIEGRESYGKAYEDAITMGASLPEMGSIVPYGTTVQLIPDVEAFRFACTTGGSSPFEWVNIEAVYGKDGVSMGKSGGDFSITFNCIPLDRGDIAGVAVYGKRRGTGKIDGDFFPIKKLDEMAREYSRPYQNSMRDIDDFIKYRSEGKTKTDTNGREYIGKTIKGKDNKPDWEKKVYFDEIDCQYTSASGDKMYMKLAGKSFLGPYMKTRNSAAAIGELQNREMAAETGPEPTKEPESIVSALISRTANAITPESLSAEAVKEPAPAEKVAIKKTTQSGPSTTIADDSLF